LSLNGQIICAAEKSLRVVIIFSTPLIDHVSAAHLFLLEVPDSPLPSSSVDFISEGCFSTSINVRGLALLLIKVDLV